MNFAKSAVIKKLLWTSNRRNDPLTAEAFTINGWLSRPSREFEGRALSDDEFGRLQELVGQYLRDDSAAAMGEPGWRTMQPWERAGRRPGGPVLRTSAAAPTGVRSAALVLRCG